jgi:hypothetical protein
MLRVFALALWVAILCSAPAAAQTSSLYGSTSVLAPPAGQVGYTVATLPPAAGNAARYAFVTDLGGGPDMVLSDGTYWKHIRQGTVTDVAGGGTITVTPLTSPPIMRVTGTSLASTVMTIQTTNLYPGATYRILIPGTLALAASFGIQIAGISGTLSQLGASWQDVTWNGTALIKTAGGAL